MAIQEERYGNWIFEGPEHSLDSIKIEARDNHHKVARAYMGAIRVYRISRTFAEHLANTQTSPIVLKESA